MCLVGERARVASKYPSGWSLSHTLRACSPVMCGVVKRKQVYRPIRSAHRCNNCHTCNNPKLKKACLTRRREQEERVKGTLGPGTSSSVAAEDEVVAAENPADTRREITRM